MRLIWLFVLALRATTPLPDVRVATWNIDGVGKVDTALSGDVGTMQADVGWLDVLIRQEVISDAWVRAGAQGLRIPSLAISNLSFAVAITENAFRSLEVAVFQRISIEAAAEWDTTGRELTGDGYAPRASSSIIPMIETFLDLSFGDVRPSRDSLWGYLRGDLPVYEVHWKSLYGEGSTVADLDNAAERERQAESVERQLCTLWR